MPLFLTSEPAGTVRAALAEALDLVDFGIVLLGPDMRPRLLNRRVIEMWSLPRELLSPDTTFRQLLDHAARRCRRDGPAAELDAAVDNREAAVREGTFEPTTFDLTDGRRLLIQCAVTGDGSRILTLADVTGLKQEHELQQQARDEALRIGAELRFSNETLESQAAYLASLAESAEDAAQRADQAKRQLEHEMNERRVLEAQLRRMATTDALTGALNRAQVLNLGQRELERVRAMGQGLAIMMLDIDHFKSINDSHGHPAGDAALRHLVDRLTSTVRRIDLVGRLGGEEFVLILPAIPPAAALQAAQRLCARVADSAVEYGGKTIRLTVSIGLAMARDGDRTVEQVLARADAALYEAKHDGRNRVVTSEEPAAAS